ncbi:MAG: mucoidy inhibitor MuiA family protein [Hyphomicrobiaceae bacterium]
MRAVMLATLGVWLAAAATGGTASAADLVAPSRLSTVTVYPRGAEVTREIVVKIAAGAHTLILDDLPADALASSIRVEGKATGRLEIGSVDSRRYALDLAGRIESRRKAIEDEIERKQDQIAALKAEIETREMQKALIANLAQLPTRPAPTPVPGAPASSERWSDILSLIGTSAADVQRAILNARLNIRATERELEEFNRKLSGLAPKQEWRTEVRVNVVAGTPLEAGLIVRYQVAAAGWQPQYDARLTTGSRSAPPKLTLVRRAAIRQRTGESWENVAVRLSTVRPTGSSAAPDIGTVTVDFKPERPPAPPVAMAPAPVARGRAMTRSAEMARKEVADEARISAEEQQAGVEVGAFQAVFDVPGRITIPNSNEQKQVKLSETALEPALAIRTVPRRAARAFLYAKLTLPKGAPYLYGPVSLFRDQTYVGAGAMPQKAGGETHELGFGADDSVRVRFDVAEEKRGESGLISASRTDQRNYRIVLKSLHERPMAFTVMDHMPVSLNQEIKVDLIGRTTPTRRDIDGKRGVLAWDDTLAPDEERTIDFGYRMTWPAAKEIQVR